MSRLPVLTFHAIHDAATPVAFGVGAFARAMRRLRAAGFRTVAAAEAARVARGEIEAPPRAFAITFDDGYASVLRAAAPVLRECGFSATLYLATDLLDRDVIFPGDPLCPNEPALTWDDAKALAEEGFDIGSHAMRHRPLAGLPDVEIDAELRGSRALLERRLGVPVRSHAYPFGAVDARVVAATRAVYDAAFTTDLDYVRQGCDPAALPRLDAHYLRFLDHRGDLLGLRTRTWILLRRAGRRARALATGRGSA